MGGGKLILGLGAVTASSLMAKPDPPTVPLDRQYLARYYKNIIDLAGYYVPREWPGWIPLDFGLEFSAENMNDSVTWSMLAGHHNTSTGFLIKEYLKWQCQESGIPYDEDILNMDCLCRSRLTMYHPDDRISSCSGKYMERREPEEEPKEPEKTDFVMERDCEPILSTDATTVISKDTGETRWIETPPVEQKIMNNITILMSNTVLFLLLVAAVIVIPYQLALETENALFFLFTLLVVPLAILRFNANRMKRLK